jgi:hypothetical protein
MFGKVLYRSANHLHGSHVTHSGQRAHRVSRHTSELLNLIPGDDALFAGYSFRNAREGSTRAAR